MSCERAHIKLSENTSLTIRIFWRQFEDTVQKRNLQDIFLALKITNLYANAYVQSIYAERIAIFLFRN